MRQGFTLVEILIVIGVFGILMVAGTDFLVQVVRNSNQAAIQNEVRQNASKVLQEISASIRNSACVAWSVDANSWTTLTTYSDNCQTVADQYKFVYDPRFSPDPLKSMEKYMDISGKVLKKVGVSGTEDLISSNSVAVIDCANASQCGASSCGIGVTFTGTKMTNKAVKIDLVIQATTSASRADFCAVTKLSDTITPRGQY